MNALTVTQSHDFNNQIFLAISRAQLQPSTKRAYTKTVERYLDSGRSLLNVEDLQSWAATASTSAKGFLKAAVKLLAKHLTVQFKGQATPDNVQAIQASIYQLEAVTEAFTNKQPAGHKTHTWLNRGEVIDLRRVCDSGDLKGLRNVVVIGLALHAGLRREELVNLKFEDIKRQGDRYSLSVIGKGNKPRTVPVKQAFVDTIIKWQKAIDAPLDSPIARGITKGGIVRDGMTSASYFELVRRLGKQIEKPDLAPHDLRRTYARLGYDAGINIAQVSKLLGHANIATTQKYLGIEIDLSDTISDHIPF